MEKGAGRKAILGLGGAAVALGLLALAWQSSQKQAALDSEVLWDRVEYEVTARRKDADTLEFTATQGGRPFDLLENQKLLHVTAVSNTLADVDHFVLTLNVLEAGPGRYEVDYPLQNDRDYLLWFETNSIATRDHHGEESDFAARALIPAAADAATPEIEPKLVDDTGEYEMRVGENTLTAGGRGRLTVGLFDSAGKPLALRQDFDHFYTLVSFDQAFYASAHVDQERLQATNTTVSTLPIQVPEPGKHALWMAVYPQAAAVGEEFTPVTGTFVVEVK